jgi:hypothetical protein
MAACADGLETDLYKHTQSENEQDAATAYIVLSHIALSESFINQLRKDFTSSRERSDRFYLAYVLSKRTQESSFTDAFVDQAGDNLTKLTQNNSNWIALTSPLYDHLSFHALTKDSALRVMFEVANRADGAILAVVSEDLYQIYQRSPGRFSALAEASGFDYPRFFNNTQGLEQ